MSSYADMAAVVDKWRSVAVVEVSHFDLSVGEHPVAWWFDAANASTADFLKGLAEDPALVVPGRPADSLFLTRYLRPTRAMGRRLRDDRAAVERWIADGAPLTDVGGLDMTNGFKWIATKAPVAGSRTDDIWFHDENIGWAVNSNGQILATRDGFETYEEQAHLKGNYLRCVAFADERVGWVGTLDREQEDERLYHTRDGGRSWSKVTNLPTGGPGRICGLSVVDANTVFASGTNYPNEESAVLKTLDGGATWIATNIAGQAAILVDILFTSADEGWVVGGEDAVKHPGRDPVRDDIIAAVLHTRDGGATWQNVLAPIRKYLPRGEWGWKIQMIDRQILVVALENMTAGAILRSDDGGASWRRIPVNDRQRNANLEGIGFVDRNTGWVGGWGDRDFRGGFTSGTRDGGQTWEDANQVGFRINRFRFIGDPVRVGYASGQTVYKYTDQAGAEELVSAMEARPLVPTLEAVDEVSIPLQVPEGARRLTVRVWEQFGRFVAQVLDVRDPAPGETLIRWDFTDESGEAAEGDAFLVRITVDDQSTSQALARHVAGS